MYELRAFATPNSLKPVIMLEETGLEYDIRAVDLRQGEQRSEAFRTMNPNAKVPVLIDRGSSEGPEVILSESAAILVYLADKSGQFLPSTPVARAKVFEQLFFHASGVSPAFLQAFLITIQKEAPPEARKRALTEVGRVLSVLDHVLERHRYVAGTEYTIADVAHFGWLWRHEAVGAAFGNFPSVGRWFAEVRARPAVVSAIAKTTALAG